MVYYRIKNMVYNNYLNADYKQHNYYLFSDSLHKRFVWKTMHFLSINIYIYKSQSKTSSPYYLFFHFPLKE